MERRCLLHSFAGDHVQLSGNLRSGRGSPQCGPQEVQIPDPVLHRCGGGIFSIVLCGVLNSAPQEGEGMSNSQFCQVAEKRVYTVEEIANMLRISRTAAYELERKRSSQSSGPVDGSGCPEPLSMHGWTAGEPDNRVKELYIWRRS